MLVSVTGPTIMNRFRSICVGICKRTIHRSLSVCIPQHKYGSHSPFRTLSCTLGLRHSGCMAQLLSERYIKLPPPKKSDLTSAFDCVNRSKLWPTLLDLGMDADLVAFLHTSHFNLTASVRYNENGCVSTSWVSKRAVRQGCLLPLPCCLPSILIS